MNLDTRAALKAQIEILGQDLKRIDTALNGVQTTTTQIDDKLRKRVRLRFSSRIQKLQSDLNEVRQMSGRGEDLNSCWDAFRNVKMACAPLFEECLAILEGALARSAGLDNGLCVIADALIQDLGQQADRHWHRFTVLAEGDLFSDVAEVVRLRFPATGIWSLPIAAHEFGHFMSSKIITKDPLEHTRDAFQEFLLANSKWQSPQWFYLHELFADLFATYALGPAYAYSAILLRFDPRRGHDEIDEKHPSFAKRVHLILATLERMNRDDLTLPYSGIIADIREFWKTSLQALQKNDSLDPEIENRLEIWTDTLYDLLKQEFPAVQFRCWPEALQLSVKFLSGDSAAHVLSKSTRFAEILNAAWLCWLRSPEQEQQISSRAVEMCAALVPER
jgi:hypothetical protein